MYETLKQELEYYIENQDELVKRYGGNFIVIKNKVVLGAYDDELEAIKETAKKHAVGTFLVQKCDPGTENYTQTYHSRVTFI